MTIQDQPVVLSYQGNGSTTEFTTPYFVDESDIIATKVDNATGVATVLTINVDYLLDDEGVPAGGKLITTVDKEILTGETLFIRREVPLDQETEYSFNDEFPSEATEDAFDKLTAIDQQQQEAIDRSLKSSVYGDGQYELAEGSEPASTPVDGGVLYVESNILKIKLPDGKVYIVNLTEEV